MKNENDSDVVAELLEKSLETPSEAFNNWLNGEGKGEFIWALQALNTDQPGIVRYIMQYAFQAGMKAK